MKCYVCKSTNNTLLKKVNKRPSCEIEYGISDKDYYREIRQCKNCLVVFNEHKNLITKNFYTGYYNKAINGKAIENRFDKIIQFSYINSDNKQRVKRIIDYLYMNDYDLSKISLIDIGTGTGVFLHEINKFGIEVSCIDPDPIAIKHIKKRIKLKSVYTGKFESIKDKNKYDIITFNKVLEHVKNPVKQLKKAKTLLNKEGIIYIELPDSTQTLKSKTFLSRAEFNVEHYTIFNIKSLLVLLELSNFEVLKIDRVTDPSGKRTIYAFAKK